LLAVAGYLPAVANDEFNIKQIGVDFWSIRLGNVWAHSNRFHQPVYWMSLPELPTAEREVKTRSEGEGCRMTNSEAVAKIKRHWIEAGSIDCDNLEFLIAIAEEAAVRIDAECSQVQMNLPKGHNMPKTAPNDQRHGARSTEKA
jgi:hypothetical protein